MSSFRGKRMAAFFIPEIFLFFLWGMERAYVIDYLIGIDKKILNCLTKVTLLGKVKTAIRSVISLILV